jgi:hypothetical protein
VCSWSSPQPQASTVKQLKKDGAAGEVIEAEVAKLQALRAELDTVKKAQGAATDDKPFNRAGEAYIITDPVSLLLKPFNRAGEAS